MNKLLVNIIGFSGLSILVAIGTNYICNELLEEQKKIILEKGELAFDDISILEIHNGFIYTLYLNNKEILNFTVYNSESCNRGMITLEINENTENNIIQFNYKNNYWNVYDNEYDNKIIINLTSKTKITKK
jgi:hypothetical protein